jgi:hypothetical protein
VYTLIHLLSLSEPTMPDITYATPADRAPRVLLRLEGLALLVTALCAYAWMARTVPSAPGWGLFAAAFLLPDLAMLGYLRSPRAGAWSYNLAHTDTAPAILLGVALLLHAPTAVAVSLIWLAHIGFDRMAGYGLKYTAGFGHTHLGDVGRGVRIG